MLFLLRQVPAGMELEKGQTEPAGVGSTCRGSRGLAVS